MSTAGSTSSRSLQVTEAERRQIEATFANDLKLKGVIVFTEFDAKFMYVPIDGFIAEAPLSSMISFGLLGKMLSLTERDEEFQLIMMPGHEGFAARVFIRVEEGI